MEPRHEFRASSPWRAVGTCGCHDRDEATLLLARCEVSYGPTCKRRPCSGPGSEPPPGGGGGGGGGGDFLMPRFVEISTGRGRCLVSTNAKVMSTSLRGHPNFRAVDEFTFARELCRKRRPHLLLTRHPKDRLVSTYVSKFVDRVDRVGTEKFQGWEHIHRIHFKYLDLSESSSDEIIVAAFRNFDFSSFVSLLPKTRMRDGHLLPQYLLEYVCLKHRVPLFSSCVSDRIQIENLDCHDGLWDRWGIDVGRRWNRSSRGTATYGTEADDRLIRKLYARDFELYGYV